MSELTEAAERLKKYHDSGDLNVYRDSDGNHDFDQRINDERQVRNWSIKLLDTRLLADLTDEEWVAIGFFKKSSYQSMYIEAPKIFFTIQWDTQWQVLQVAGTNTPITTVGQLRHQIAAMGGGT